MIFSIQKECITAISADGIPMGYITFPQIRNGLVNINQVVTYHQFCGQGVANNLMEALLIHLDKQNQKAALNCPIAQNYMEQHGQWRHLLPEKICFTTY